MIEMILNLDYNLHYNHDYLQEMTENVFSQALFLQSYPK